MRQLLMVMFVALLAQASFCQQILHDNVTGKPYSSGMAEKTLGTPFLFDDWSMGVVYLNNDLKTDQYLLKFDMYSNVLLFKQGDKSLVFVNPVKAFVISRVVDGSKLDFYFRCGYKSFEKYDESTFYQVLQDGPVSLLKQTRKSIATVSNYGSGSGEKEFVNTLVYLVAKPDGELMKIKKEKSSLLAAIGEPSGKLEAWVNKEKIRCKNEKEMMDVVRVFNENTYQ